MKINRDQKVRLTVSVDSYQTKDEATACMASTELAKTYGKEKLGLREMTFDSIDQFAGAIKTGHVFSGLYDYGKDEVFDVLNEFTGQVYQESPFYQRGPRKGSLKLGYKSDEHFASSQVIYVDIDLTDCKSMQEFLGKLPDNLQPTLAYTTFSDLKDKGGIVSRRFRLVYVFETQLPRIPWLPLSACINAEVSQCTGELPDITAIQCVQQMCGAWNADIIYTYRIFSPEDFDWTRFEPSITFKSDKTLKVSDRLFRDSICNTKSEFYSKYHKLRYLYRTADSQKWISWNEDYEYQVVDKNTYLQLWVPLNGKISHGRHNLFRGLPYKIRLIDPLASIDEVYFTCVCYYNNFIDNSDCSIDKDYIKNCVEASFNNYSHEKNIENNKEWIEGCKRLDKKVITRVTPEGTKKGIKSVSGEISRQIVGHYKNLGYLSFWKPGMSQAGFMEITGLSEAQTKRIWSKYSLKSKEESFIIEHLDKNLTQAENLKNLKNFWGIEISLRTIKKLWKF